MASRPAGNRPSLPARGLGFVLLVGIVLVLTGPFHMLAPRRATAHVALPPVQVGTSFSARRAEYLGLDYRDAFRRLESMGFKVIRISTYWDEVDADGYGRLDWLMAEAGRSRQEIALSVGMKGLGWPEFYIPGGMQLAAPGDGRAVSEDAELKAAALLFVRDTVLRYRANPSLIAWQVENEPFNKAGPHHWYIDRPFLLQEVKLVKALDGRPVIVNAFGHFNMLFDKASDRSGFELSGLLGFEAGSAERDALSTLSTGDILGLDVYTGIGYRFLGVEGVSRAGTDWAEQMAGWRQKAVQQGKRTWITEAQAEPWESSMTTYAQPRSISPEQVPKIFNGLKDEGFGTILLWGAEYWLWRADNNDRRWLDTVSGLLQRESRAPAIQ